MTKKERSNALLLLLVTFLSNADIGSCLLSSPSRYCFSPLRPSTLSKTVTPCKSSTDIYEGNAVDSNDDISDGSWSESGDWASSIYSETSSTADTSSEFDEEENTAKITEKKILMSEEDIWIQDAVDEIHNAYSTLNDQPLYDTSFDEPSADDSIKKSIDNDMDDEIAMLIRCNEQPVSLLIKEGRALSPLAKEEKNDVSQLVVLNKDTCEATEFLKDAVSKMFREHAVPSVLDEVLSMDRACIASWMTKSLREEGEGKVGPHDKRVVNTLSDFSVYGSGRLVEKDFQNLYLKCIVGDISNLSSVTPTRHLQLRTPYRDVVWRDIRAHGILSPIEEERSLLMEEFRVRDSELTVHGDSSSNKNSDQMFIDECEILDWDYRAPEPKKGSKPRQNSRDSSSHKLVKMANDQKTPLRIRDGEFVFIDEESCIGCIQCATIAPSSFSMKESGRARTFSQRIGGDVEQAVDACPVSCMHRVSYQELSAFETARDEGDGRTDHKHLGNRRGHVPLHVAGMDSDNNRRSSWYHTLQARCVTSSSCPQKGCYDCPSYQNPGENPFFVAKHKQAEHIRAQQFIENGEADLFRKAVDL